MAGLYFKVGSDYENVIRLRTEIEKLKSTLSGMDGNTPPATLRAMEAQLVKNTKELDTMVSAAAKAGNELDQNFKKKIFDSSMAVNRLSEDILDTKEKIDEYTISVRRLSEYYKTLSKSSPNFKVTEKELADARKNLELQKDKLKDLQLEQGRARISVKKLKDEYALFNKESASTVDVSRQIETAMGNMAKKVFSVVAAKEFVSQVIEVRAEMQMLNKSFEVLLGSKDKADLYVKEIKDYALVSPLSVSDVSKAAQTLLGFNVEAEKTIPIIKSIGDISMGDSQKFGSLTLAFSQMSAAGRLMGQDLNQMINAGFNPLQVISEKTGKSIAQLKKEMESGAISSQMVADAFSSATAEGGKFHGMIEKSADGIRNAQNQLTGAIQDTLNSIGESQEGIIKGSYEVATSLVQNYDKVGRVIAGLIVTYGAYRTAVMLATIAENGHSVSMLLTRERILLVRKAQQLLNATMLANPYVAITTLVVGLAAAMWTLSKNTSSAEKAQKMFNEEQNKFTQQERDRRQKVEELIHAIQDETETELEKIKAYEELQKYSPVLTSSYKLEELATLDLAKSQKVLNEERDKADYDNLIKKSEESRKKLQQLRAENGKLLGISPSTGIPLTVNNNAAIKAEEELLKKYQKAIDDIQKKKNELNAGNSETKVLSSISDEISNTTKKIAILKQDISDLRSGKISVEAGKTVQSAIEEKTKELRAAEDSLSTLTGRDKSSDNKAKDERKKQLEKQKAIYKELLDLRIQNQQSEIDLMKDGSEKKIAQINLDYDKEIAAILAKEKEWKDAQNGKLIKEQTVEIQTALVNSYVKKEKSTGLISSEQLAEEKRMMNEFLKEYGSYMEKRQAITELYNEKISKALTSGEKLSLSEEMKKELAAVDDEAQKKTSIITTLFSDMSKRTVADIRAIAKEAQEMLDYVNNGEFKTGSDGKGLFGLTKEQFDILSKSPEKLQAIKDEIANVNREADQCETAFNKMSGGLKKVFAAGDDARKLKEGLAEIEEGMNDVMQAGQFLTDTFSKLGDAFGGAFSGIAEGLNVVMDTMSSAMNGAKAGAMFGPIGASAGAAIGVVSSLASAIAKIHDKKNEKRIERLQDQIDTLDKSYEKLDKSIQKAYSNDASKLIDQQNKLLEQQKVLIQQQIREEQDKKKTDKDRIKDWQDQIDEINQAIADNKEKAVDAIFGSDIKSAIDDFANAQAEAWASGENRAESAKDTVKKMMRQMVTESIKAATDSSGAMEKIRQKLKEFYADNVLSGWEQDYIYNMAEELQKELDRQFGWADSLMKNEKEGTDASDNSLKGAYAKADQETIGLLAGQTGAARVVLEDIRNNMQPVREQMKLIYDMQSKGWEDVHAIRDLSDKVEKNTEQIAENTREIKDVAGKISENTKGTVEALEGTINVKVKM